MRRFDNAEFAIGEDNERVCLAGRNGAGNPPDEDPQPRTGSGRWACAVL